MITPTTNWFVTDDASDDDHLVRLAQGHDREQGRDAVGKLYAKYNRELWLVVRKRVHAECDAKDICMETWKRAIERMPEYEPRGKPFIAWLVRIAGNVRLEQWRQADGLVSVETLDDTLHVAAQQIIEQVAAEGPPRAQGADGSVDEDASGDAAVQAAADCLLMTAVQGLSACERQIIMLRYFEDAASLKDVADSLGLNQSTVRVYHRRALDKIKSFLCKRGLFNESKHN